MTNVIERRAGRDAPIIAIAGWATGPRLFDAVCPGHAMVMVTPFNIDTVGNDTLEVIESCRVLPTVIIGVSMGGVVAARVGTALGIPWIAVGANVGIECDVIDPLRSRLNRNKDAALRSFWVAASGHRDDTSWVKSAFSADDWSLPFLEAGLTFLMQNHWDATINFKLGRFVHGERDAIAPVHAIVQLARNNGVPLTLLPGLGHLVFGPNAMAQWIFDLGLVHHDTV